MPTVKMGSLLLFTTIPLQSNGAVVAV